MNLRKKFAAMALLGAIGFLLVFVISTGPASALSTVAKAIASQSHQASSNTTCATQPTSSSGTTLYRPFPEGLPAHNAGSAFKMVMNRAGLDDAYACTIAQQTGAEQFVPSDYKPVGYKPRAPMGTTNSGLNSQGQVVPVADHAGSQHVRVLIVMNFATKKTVALMVRCGNPRLRPSITVVPIVPWKRFAKGTIIRINRTESKPVSITCPSGQTVSGTLFASLKGYVKARTWGKVQGKLNLKLQVAFKAQLKSWVDLHCGPAPPPTTTTVTTTTPTTTTTPPPSQLHFSCTGFEEISGGGSFLVDCGVSDDNGAPIYLYATSNDSNSYVSGINCYSNGGSQSCRSGGTFEFRVNGVNDGSSVVMSSVTVSVSANGNQAPQPQTYTFKVDPSAGGF